MGTRRAAAVLQRDLQDTPQTPSLSPRCRQGSRPCQRVTAEFDGPLRAPLPIFHPGRLAADPVAAGQRGPSLQAALRWGQACHGWGLPPDPCFRRGAAVLRRCSRACRQPEPVAPRACFGPDPDCQPGQVPTTAGPGAVYNLAGPEGPVRGFLPRLTPQPQPQPRTLHAQVRPPRRHGRARSWNKTGRSAKRSAFRLGFARHGRGSRPRCADDECDLRRRSHDPRATHRPARPVDRARACGPPESAETRFRLAGQT